MIESTWPAILAHLHRGGAAAYYWRLPSKLSTWFDAGTPPAVPSSEDVYFGIHPATSRRGTAERATIGDIAAVNCLFAEFDAKDFAGDKARVLAHIDGLAVIPSVIVDSGGGYHCYWLFRDPWPMLGQADREGARRLQAAWVRYVGGDPGAKDLARVLRVPGTLNAKYDPPRPVAILRADLARLYHVPDLETACKPPEQLPTSPSNRNGNGRGPSEDAGQFWLDKALDLAHVGNRNTTGFWLACQLRDAGIAEAEAEGWLLAYARSVPQTAGDFYSDAAAMASLKSAYRAPQREEAKSMTTRTQAQRSAPGAAPTAEPPAWLEGEEAAPPAVPSSAGVGQRDPEHFTDLGNARRLVRLHGRDLRYCYPWTKWLVWDGLRWAIDDSGEAARRAKQTVKSMYAEAAGLPDDDGKNLAKHAIKCESAQRITAMLTMAQSEEGIPVRPREMDGDPWLLNVLNGTLDLRSGELRDHDRRHLLTKVAPVIYDPSATCPAWDAFLERVMGGNAELIGFLRRAVGYTLTGNVSEQVMFLLYGTGANGKSTFLETLRTMLGEDYARQIRPESLTDVNRGTGPTEDLARLKGARMVSARETEEGKRLAEALIKELSGGDTVTVRYLYSESFEYKPEFKLFLGANHKPVIRGTDYAIWRRIKLIPFAVTIPPEERDKQLYRKLEAELSGILNWALRGCAEWQRAGLGTAAAVDAATEAYRAESDALASFLTDCTLQGPQLQVQARPLYEAYTTWCKDSGEKPLNMTQFGRRLGELGFDKYTDRARHTFYVGLGLLAEDKEEAPRE